MTRAVLLTGRSSERQIDPASWGGRGPVHVGDDTPLPLEGESLAVVDWGDQVLEDRWEELLAFHRAGGRLLVLGVAPFNPGGSVRYLRSLGWLDAWEKAEVPPGAKLEAPDATWAFAQTVGLPPGPCGSGLWRLAHQPDPRGLLFDSATVAAARISYPLRFTWEGRTVGVPVVRLDPFKAGPILWLTTDPGRAWWQSTRGATFLEGALQSLSRGRHRLEAAVTRGRYRLDETPEVRWSVTPEPGATNQPLTLECRLASQDSGTSAPPPLVATLPLGQGSGTFSWPTLPEGFWKAELNLTGSGGPEGSAQTGFYRLGEAAVEAILAKVPRLKRDPAISPDVLSADGRPFPLHGVNYHVTDAYRACFVRYNAWQNDADLRVLAADGYNVLRTGNWQDFDRFFTEEGPLHDDVLAHLEGFFLTAARHGFQVQFVLGAFILNPWNRDQCPLHHPGQRAKVMAAFASFASRFGAWPHVQIDALNEPSYSVNGAWHLAKPSEDPRELARWREWLRFRYRDDLRALRRAWGVVPEEAPSFESLALPTDHRRFSRNYDRQDVVTDGRLSDWYAFARKVYSEWVGEIRQTVREKAPDTLFMLGRDESLRVPAQQDEAAAGNLDVVNFHQWHRDSAIHSEYAFNRVRGLPCCGQEMGTYPYGDRRNEPRLTEEHRARILERKLAYSFGNWLQWQAWNDPFMLDSIERALGLYRADGTPTPLADAARTLARFDEAHRDLVRGLDEDTTKVLLVFPTDSYFSPDAEAVFRSTLRGVRVLAERLRVGFGVVLEHLLDRPEQTGDPTLVIIPSPLTLSAVTWERLTAWAKEGKTILVTGAAGAWEGLGLPARAEPLAAVESLAVEGRLLEVSFRRALDHFEPGTLYDRLAVAELPLALRAFPLGQGNLISCPLPVEACDDDAVIEAVYRWAWARAPEIPRVFTLEVDPGPRLGVFAQPYAEATRYTLVNEGNRTTVAFTDAATGLRFEAVVPEGRAVVAWVTHGGALTATGTVRRLP